MKVRFTLALLALLATSACTKSSSDDGDSNAVPQTNACSVLGLNTRVITGTVCSETNSPVVKVNIINTDSTQGLCSGTMISSNAVLTAAHCFLEHDLQIAYIEANGVAVPASEVAIHPAVAVGSDDNNNNTPIVLNDVAIVHLSSAVTLPTLPILSSQTPRPDQIFSIFGYGLDENNNLGVLRSGQSLIESVTSQNFTARYDGVGSNSCNGDSGGPAILTLASGQNAIIGLVSSGTVTTCQVGDLSYYANVTSADLLSFIQQEVPTVSVL
ncbi:MAG: trypsin-like serine protease [Oligoflexia bacterium]|nr:trypsin-like serine protease [Oligoflexia bacterium]